MKTSHKLSVSSITLLVGLVGFCKLAQSQSVSFSEVFANFSVSDHYEFNDGGVPRLGLITAAGITPPSCIPPTTQISFKFCGGMTREVDCKQLTRSARRCPPPPKDDDPWRGALSPLIKDDSKTVRYRGKPIEVGTLPTPAKDTLSKAKPGDWVGYGFTAKDGSKQAVFFGQGDVPTR
jgi:hypothetical protein